MDKSSTVFERLDTLRDVTRSRLLAILEEHEMSVSELVRVVQLPQSTVSRHLGILGDAGWVRSRADGTSRYYRMTRELPPDAGALWNLVRRELADDTVTRRDRERTRSVLDLRRDRSKAFFSRSAARWEEVRDELYGAGAEALPLFGLLDPGWIVADLGAGTGSLARSLAPFVRRVIAVDRSREMLDAAREACEGRPGRVELREGELEALPLEDGCADLTVLSLVLHYLPRPRTAIEEAVRVTRPGGRVVIVDMRPHERVAYREEMGHLWQGFEEETLLGWMTGAGMTEAVVRPLPPDPEASGPLLFMARGTRCGGDG